MAKLNLNPEPTFKAPVPVPVPGHDPVEVVFHFKYKDRDELKDLMDRLADKKSKVSDVDAMMEICCDWEDIDQEFSRESVELFDQKWHGGASAVFDTYVRELKGTRRKK